jgi:hypothetical protein
MLGPCWAIVGASRGYLVPCWGQIGVIFGPSWGYTGSTGTRGSHAWTIKHQLTLIKASENKLTTSWIIFRQVETWQHAIKKSQEELICVNATQCKIHHANSCRAMLTHFQLMVRCDKLCEVAFRQVKARRSRWEQPKTISDMPWYVHMKLRYVNARVDQLIFNRAKISESKLTQDKTFWYILWQVDILSVWIRCECAFVCWLKPGHLRQRHTSP